MEIDENSDVEKAYLDSEATKVIQEFCYLGDNTKAQGGSGADIIKRIKSGSIRFQETSAITNQQRITTVD